MTWLQVTVSTTEDQADLVESLLEDLSALSITMQDAGDDPVLEPDVGATPLWKNTRVIALFSSDTSIELIRSQLLHQGFSDTAIVSETIEDRDWEREWMTHFKPMQFGRRLWICPSWHTPDQNDTINLMLDPGLAFGTGTHPTTALCLTWLDSQELRGTNLLDFGCGSGILGIAGLLLGAARVSGVDIDPQALDASRENATRNGVSKQLTLYPPEAFQPATQFDYVIANILAKPLIDLAPNLAAHCRPQGKLALSGILKDQEVEVATAYAPYFSLESAEYQDDWVLISGKRHSD